MRTFLYVPFFIYGVLYTCYKKYEVKKTE